MKNLALLALLASATLPVAAQTVAVPEPAPTIYPVITLASELEPWCRDEAEARFIADGGTPYQWSASHFSRGKVLHVKGRLRVDGTTYLVECRVARGARAHYASIDIEEEFPR